eukprot:bmy_16480T0
MNPDKPQQPWLLQSVCRHLQPTLRRSESYIQHRKGPNIVGPHDLLQPIADAIKLFIKEPLRPATSSTSVFIIAPILALTLALTI